MSPFRRELLIVFGVLVVMLGLAARQFRTELLLSRHAQEVQATVVAKQSHAWIGYAYQVNGTTYEGSTPASATGKAIDRVQLGDTFTVMFDPTNPGVSGTSETHEVVTSTIPFILFAFVVAVAIVFARDMMRRP